MKEYNCPDCRLKAESCDGCPRVKDKISNMPVNERHWFPTTLKTAVPPDPCKYCLNHPSNGGSGICNCVLGGMNVRYY